VGGIRVRLRVGIVAIFALLLVPLTGLMIGVLYYHTSRLADDSARAAMQRATADVIESLRTSLQPISRAIEISVAFGQVQGLGLTRPEAWLPLFSALEIAQDTYSLFYGFNHGEFLQAVRLPKDIEKYGPHGEKPPAAARYVVRLIDDSSGEMADVLFYMANWGEVIKIERASEVRYNPRQRPWFKAARDESGAVNSGVYVFSGSGRPGFTLSQRIETKDGGFVGVFGADVSLDSMASTLAASLVGTGGRIFILDEEGRLIAHPDAKRVVKPFGDTLKLVRGEEFDDRLIAEAVTLYRQGRGDSFNAVMGPEQHSYLVSFSTVPKELKRPWIIGIIADKEEFIAPYRRVSVIILEMGAAFLVLVGIGILMASRLLTRPIASLIKETDNIRRLELDTPVHVPTPVHELTNLAKALDNMKSALRSFGVYVPKEVVRSIVTSGTDSVVGGTRQKVTVMFTDLKGFTASSEQLEPEEVLRRLSDYFDVMSRAIHGSGGTIDKFIGDAIMALWNAPVLDPQHEISACRGALTCLAANRALNARIAEHFLPPWVTRFGLHSESVVVGNVGSSDRMQYTALGSAVNLASRVEGMNKVFGTDLLVTDTIEAAARGHFLFRPFGPVVAVGTSLPTPLFELMAESGDQAATEVLDTWLPAFEAYAAGRWGDAASGFQSFLAKWPEDGAASLFLARSLAFVETPPGPDWDGCFHLDSK
jgi:adenylate cyclase